MSQIHFCPKCETIHPRIRPCPPGPLAKAGKRKPPPTLPSAAAVKVPVAVKAKPTPTVAKDTDAIIAKLRRENAELRQDAKKAVARREAQRELMRVRRAKAKERQ